MSLQSLESFGLLYWTGLFGYIHRGQGSGPTLSISRIPSTQRKLSLVDYGSTFGQDWSSSVPSVHRGLWKGISHSRTWTFRVPLWDSGQFSVLKKHSVNEESPWITYSFCWSLVLLVPSRVEVGGKQATQINFGDSSFVSDLWVYIGILNGDPSDSGLPYVLVNFKEGNDTEKGKPQGSRFIDVFCLVPFYPGSTDTGNNYLSRDSVSESTK